MSESAGSQASRAPDGGSSDGVSIVADRDPSPNRGVYVGLAAFLLLAIGTAVAGWYLFIREESVDPSQVVLEGVGTRSLGPFVRQPAGRSSPIGSARLTLEPAAAVTSLSGSTPELYGVRLGSSNCDRERLGTLIEIDPLAAAAWTGVLGLDPSLVQGYVASLTPAVLRHDLRVTDHEWSLDQVGRRQAVLEAGTAVLIDERGVPTVRCVSGSPLLPPDGSAVPATASSVGAWPEFDPATLVTIVPADAMEIVELFDLAGGSSVIRPIGSGGEQDIIGGRSAAETVIIPDPVRASPDQTRNVLDAVGLVASVVDVMNASVPPGQVVRLVPSAGARVDAGSEIVIEVSVGAERREILVPNVVGRQIDEAIQVLQTAGISFITETDNSRARPSGEVISTTPSAFEFTRSDQPVQVIVSRLENVRVPDVKGLTLAAARDELVEFGLRPLVLERYDAATPAGLVINTLPGTNTRLLATSDVTLAISLGPPPRREAVPDVRGLTVEASEAAVRAAGFEIDYDETESADVPQGLVAFSVPGTGTNYIVGSPVKLVISTGAPPERIEVPEVAGLSLGEAGNRLRALGLRVTTSESFSPDVPEGDVVLLIPGPGTQLIAGEQVVLYKSLGPEPGTATTTTTTTTAPAEVEDDDDDDADAGDAENDDAGG